MCFHMNYKLGNLLADESIAIHVLYLNTLTGNYTNIDSLVIRDRSSNYSILRDLSLKF